MNVSRLVGQTFSPEMQSHILVETLMQERIFKIAVFLIGLLFFGCVNASAQQVQPKSQSPAGSAEGTLAVTATVVSSTGLVIGPDGQQRVIVANAPDRGDDASPWPAEQAVKVVMLSPVPEPQSDAKPPTAKPQKP